MERALYLDLASRLEAGNPVAVATLVRAWGSTPREVGAKMLIDPEGRIAGTIGGGCGEAEAWQVAREAMKGGNPRLVHVNLTEDFDDASGRICGGRLDVLVEGLRPDSVRDRALARALREGCEEGRELALMAVLGPTSSADWRRPEAVAVSEGVAGEVALGTRLALVPPENLVGSLGDRQAEQALLEQARQALRQQKPTVVSVDVGGQPWDVFIDVMVPAQELVIAGAGHIARPLCRMAALCGYRVTVVDDRPEFADPAYFPEAAEVVCRPFVEAFHLLQAGPRTHVVLVTRGHKHDEECLRALLGKAPAYLGMIGSRRRTGAVFQELEAEGVDPAWLDRVHAPIGIDLGAETPEEIAVAILAEMIAVRRGGQAPSLSLRGSPQA